MLFSSACSINCTAAGVWKKDTSEYNKIISYRQTKSKIMMKGSVALVCNNRPTLDPVALQCNKLGIDGWRASSRNKNYRQEPIILLSSLS